MIIKYALRHLHRQQRDSRSSCCKFYSDFSFVTGSSWAIFPSRIEKIDFQDERSKMQWLLALLFRK